MSTSDHSGEPFLPAAPANYTLRQHGAKGQCATCQHWKRQGGVILPATMGCRAFNAGLFAPSNSELLLQAIALERAERGACPVFLPWQPWPAELGAYIAEELPLPPAPAIVTGSLPKKPEIRAMEGEPAAKKRAARKSSPAMDTLAAALARKG